MAYQTDLLEYGDLFDGNRWGGKIEELKEGGTCGTGNLDSMGGAIAADRLHEGAAGRE